MGHSWRPIAPLPSDWEKWVDSELSAIRAVWRDLQEAMGERTAAKVHERMLTEWSIETGMVEDLYRWDRGVTETLLTHGVRADRIPDGASSWSPELVAQVIQDQISVVEGLFAYVKEERPISTSFIHELHAQLLRNVPRNYDLGKWKTGSNWVTLPDGSTHEYCPPEHVAAEMDRLLELNSEYEAKHVPVEIRAAWLHHRFTQIHPYTDGNGRTARALATLLLVKDHLFPLIIRQSEKHMYFDDLEAADGGDEGPLIHRFRGLQRREVVKMSVPVALTPPENRPPATIQEALDRVRDKLEYSERVLPDLWAPLFGKVDALGEEITKQINELVERLTRSFATKTGYGFRSVVKDGDTLGFRPEALDYQPRYARINKTICLQIAMPVKWRIACAIHETGPRTNGLASCVVYLSPPSEELRAVMSSPSEYFLISYAEPLPDIHARFSKWLEKQLINTLDLWQQQL